MWSIVLFEIDNTVNVVPNFWYSNGVCQWPKKNHKINPKSLIKRRVKFDEVTFNSYKARPLQQNIGSYTEAEAKAVKAQETSELSSYDDDKNTRKFRKEKLTSPPITKKYKEIATLPEIPVLDEAEDKAVESDNNDSSITDYDSDEKNVYFTHSVKAKSSPVIFSQLSNGKFRSESPKNMHYSLDKHEPSTSFAIKDQKKNQVTYSGSKKQKINHMTIIDQSNEDNNQFRVRPTISPSTTTINNDDGNENDLVFRKFIRRSLTNLKYDIENIHKRLDAQESLMEKILDKLDSQESKSMAHYNLCNDVEIPVINTDEDLKILEEKLINDGPYRITVITLLSRFVGSTLSETIRRIMQRMFTDEFLSNYSFIGFKGKNQFSKLQCCSIVYDVVRSTKKFKDATNQDIEKTVKNWMAQATPRIKKKKQGIVHVNNDVVQY